MTKTPPLPKPKSGAGVRVTYRNFIFMLEVHFPVRSSERMVCPLCKEWKGREVKMVQRQDIYGNRWWYCKSNFFKRKWSQCGTIFPVDMYQQRIKYLNALQNKRD